MPDRGHRSVITVYYTVDEAGNVNEVDPYYRNFTYAVSERLPRLDMMISDWLRNVEHDACAAVDASPCRRFTVLRMRYVYEDASTVDERRPSHRQLAIESISPHDAKSSVSTESIPYDPERVSRQWIIERETDYAETIVERMAEFRLRHDLSDADVEYTKRWGPLLPMATRIINESANVPVAATSYSVGRGRPLVNSEKLALPQQVRDILRDNYPHQYRPWRGVHSYSLYALTENYFPAKFSPDDRALVLLVRYRNLFGTEDFPFDFEDRPPYRALQNIGTVGNPLFAVFLYEDGRIGHSELKYWG